MGNSIPGCVGYHGKPIGANGPCEKCAYKELCRKVVAKERLQPLVSQIVECRKFLKGEKT